MAATDALLPLREVTRRLKILGQSYVGVQSIRVDRIAGSVDRTVDFDRFFRPQNRQLRARLDALRVAFAGREVPPISVYEAGGVYFVMDGHHRVALSRQLGSDFIDAEVTAIRTSHTLHPGVDFLELVHTEQHRIFMERSGLDAAIPDAKIEFSRPTGYGELLAVVEAHAYQLSATSGNVVAMPEATADWYATSYRPALEAIHTDGLAARFDYKTDGDLYLWVNRKRRELQTTEPGATWKDAVAAALRDQVPRNHRRDTLRQRRSLLASEGPKQPSRAAGAGPADAGAGAPEVGG
jgi:hypothetical protein